MSMTSTIHRAVDQAFTALGDLVKPGLLVSNAAVGYNFSTGQNISLNNPSEAVQVVEINNITNESNANKNYLEFIIKEPTVDLSLYDKITVEGKEYLIESFDQFEGIAILKIRRR